MLPASKHCKQTVQQEHSMLLHVQMCRLHRRGALTPSNSQPSPITGCCCGSCAASHIIVLHPLYCTHL
jgi:hypothetical protein